MHKSAPEIVSLKRDIENQLKQHFKTPYDFEHLAAVIWERLRENVSPTTLKRLWGYIDGAERPRRATLCLLARFLGYTDWEDYLQDLKYREDIESDPFVGEGVHLNNLSVDDLIEVTWLPNRRCIFKYEGNAKFVVVEAVNTKLQVGDKFETACLLVGQPMFLDNLITVDNHAPAGCSFVAGTKSGLVSVQKIEK